MIYDLIIIGNGPAGLSAGLYGARSNLKTLIIGAQLGGTMLDAFLIENYPGIEEISGTELAQKLKKQVEKLNGEIIEDAVEKIQKKSDSFEIFTNSNKKYQSKALILALGTQHRKLNVPGEEKLMGRGVSYCATCDSPFFKDKTVAVVGGGDSAVKAAMLAAQHSKKVYILVRGEKLTCEPLNEKNCKKNPKIEIIYKVNVKEIKGETKVESVLLDNNKELKVGGMFVEIGLAPVSALANELKLELDERKFIKVDSSQRTNIPLVYAAGDISNAMGGFKQILTAAAQGAIAATSAFRDLKHPK